MSPSTLLAALLQRLAGTHFPLEEERLQQTVEYAERLYRDQQHWTGGGLLEHTLNVLQGLLPFQPDTDTIVSCILQHALETHAVSTTELEEEFGARVRRIVSSVHLLSRVSPRLRGGSIEDLRLMLLSIADDVGALLIVLCDRVVLLERAEHIPPADRKRLAREALNLFSPVASRLGIHTLKQRLELLAFPIVYPADAERIAEQLMQVKERAGDFLDHAALLLRDALLEHGITAAVQGRQKQIYSVFAKMRSRGFTHIESLPDLFALRVIVEKEEDCYRTLGVLHRLGRPVPNRFKDYIAFPKPNGYQSLHTTLTRLPGLPEGVFVEIQVRSATMHREAEYGIAAHWSYKEGGTAEQSLRRVQLQQALASQYSVHGETTGAAKLADHIFVLTPKGDIIELPEGATPIDFAFQIHTDVGLSFRAARVNGSIVPLDYELENGDVVEVLTHRAPRPSPAWLQLLKMASSRSRLKRYLHSINRNEYLVRGRELLNEELRKRHLPLLDGDLGILRRHEGRELALPEREDLVVKIGQGTDKVGSLLQRLDLLRVLRPVSAVQTTKVKQGRMQRKDALVEVEGDVPMPVRFAKCCLSAWPAGRPGSPSADEKPRIIGVITRSGEVMVHAVKCRNVVRGNPERRVAVRWRKQSL